MAFLQVTPEIPKFLPPAPVTPLRCLCPVSCCSRLVFSSSLPVVVVHAPRLRLPPGHQASACSWRRRLQIHWPASLPPPPSHHASSARSSPARTDNSSSAA